MKKYLILFFQTILFVSLSFSEEWKTIYEKNTVYQYIMLAESDTELCTLAASTTFSDGTLIFYCHAGKRDKKNLMNIYENLALNLDMYPTKSVVGSASSQIKNLRNTGVIKLINFDTEPPEYTDGYITQKSHVYCDSWIDRPLKEMQKK